MSFYLGKQIKMGSPKPKPTSLWTKVKTKLKQWWKNHIVDEVPKHLEDQF